MKIAVLYNPQARAHKKSQDWLSFWNSLDVDLHICDEAEKLAQLVKAFSKEKYDLVFISGGDGSVQATQTAFGNLKENAHLPMLCLLPHGTTNMTASDIGLKPASKTKISSIISQKNYLKRATSIKTRATIKAHNVKNSPAQYGVFLGTGVLLEAVKKFHAGKEKQKLKGHFATGKILLTEIFAALKSSPTDQEAIYRGYDITAHSEGTKITEGEQLFALVATLDKLILGSQPFWNQEVDKLKFTSVAWPLKKNIFSTVYNILCATDRAHLSAPEYVSGAYDTLELNIDSGMFTMDGELFEIEDGKLLKISLGPKFKYLCG